ncbi:hypothetical protein IWX46DRAFT_606720, partial [Phyllosticta citricarpa]
MSPSSFPLFVSFFLSFLPSFFRSLIKQRLSKIPSDAFEPSRRFSRFGYYERVWLFWSAGYITLHYIALLILWLCGCSLICLLTCLLTCLL